MALERPEHAVHGKFNCARRSEFHRRRPPCAAVAVSNKSLTFAARRPPPLAKPSSQHVQSSEGGPRKRHPEPSPPSREGQPRRTPPIPPLGIWRQVALSNPFAQPRGQQFFSIAPHVAHDVTNRCQYWRTWVPANETMQPLGCLSRGSSNRNVAHKIMMRWPYGSSVQILWIRF